MSGENRHIVDEQLMARFFTGETTAEENEHIDAWRTRSAANQRQFDVWRLVWLDTGSIGRWAEDDTYDVEAALARVRDRKNALQEVEQTGTSATTWVWRAAAVLVVGLGLGWFLYTRGAVEDRELVAFNESIQETLDDGSMVSLNANSRLLVKSGASDRREVFLEGEAFFDVEPDPEKPFVVKTALVSVEVLGTSFNVTEEDNTTTVSVEEGRVRFAVGDQELILLAGQTGTYDHGQKQLELLSEDDTGEHRFWKTRKLIFRGQSLEEVVAVLNRTYDKQITLATAEIGTCQLTVSFENEALEDVLEIIGITLGLEVRTKGDEIVIDGEGC